MLFPLTLPKTNWHNLVQISYPSNFPTFVGTIGIIVLKFLFSGLFGSGFLLNICLTASNPLVLSKKLKNYLYIRLTHNFHYRNLLLLVCPVGFFPLPATLFYLYVFLGINTFYMVQGPPEISNKIVVLHQ